MAQLDLPVYLQGVQIATTGALPAPSAANQGQLWIERGGLGQEDVLRLVAKTTADTYVWRTVGAAATAATLTYYVETTGNDSNNGLSPATAFATIDKALSMLPQMLQYPTTIKIGIGNFAGATVKDFDINYADPAVSAFLMIEGTLINATVATGSATGTVSSAVQGDGTTNTYGVVNDATQTWTVNDLRGKFLEITGGTGAGQVWPITENTATQITVAATFLTTLPNGTSTYAIRDCGSNINTIVNRGGSAPTPAATASACFYVASNRTRSDATALLFRYLKLSPPTNAGVRVADCTSVAFQNCMVNITGSLTGIGHVGAGRITVTGCVFSHPGTTGSHIILGGQTQTYGLTGTLTQSLFIGGGNGFFVLGVGNFLANSSQFIGTQFAINSGGHLFLWQSSGLKISGASVGFQCNAHQAGLGSMFLQVNGPIDVSSCGTGFQLGGMNSEVVCAAAGVAITGTGNTTAVALTKGARFNYTSVATLTGTTELSLDGTAVSVATFRSATPRVATTSYGSTVYE
jgi:hypothetical protein